MPMTHDSISLRGAGILNIMQPKKGVRFALDSLLLADFCLVKSRDRILEPGAGTGVISLLLAKKFSKTRCFANEVEPRAYELLCRNIELNGLAERIVPLDGDLKILGRSIALNSFDVIVANPPYTRFGAGRTSPSPERQTARHDSAASLPAWLDLQTLLKNRGRYFLVFPAARAAELMSLMRTRGLEPKRLRWVHPFKDKPASLVLIDSVKTGRSGLDVLPPLIVHEQGGGYTDEMREMFGMGRI